MLRTCAVLLYLLLYLAVPFAVPVLLRGYACMLLCAACGITCGAGFCVDTDTSSVLGWVMVYTTGDIVAYSYNLKRYDCMQVLQAQKQRGKGLQKDEARGGLRVIGRCKMGKVVTA
jgi:hypothetical protein